jgi:hypothetical protein
MTKEEFWEKWEPCDWPSIVPSEKMKREFMEDLDKLIAAAKLVP